MSTKTIAEKLGIKAGTTVWSSRPEQLPLIEPLPQDVRVVERIEDAATAFLFGDDAASLREVVSAHAGQLAKPERLWVAYPKGNRSDINRDSVWPILVEHGVRPNGQVSLDDVWSGLRFRADKPGEAPFKGGAKS
jgi:hypothetical protein